MRIFAWILCAGIFLGLLAMPTGLSANEPVAAPQATEPEAAPAAETVISIGDLEWGGLSEVEQPREAAATATANRVCRGRCTYETGPNSTTTGPCNSSCKCDRQDANGNPIFQSSCGWVKYLPGQPR